MISHRNDNAAVIPPRELRKLVYGPDSVYARGPTAAQVAGMTNADVVEFLQKWERPDNAVFGITGASHATSLPCHAVTHPECYASNMSYYWPSCFCHSSYRAAAFCSASRADSHSGVVGALTDWICTLHFACSGQALLPAAWLSWGKRCTSYWTLPLLGKCSCFICNLCL